MSDISLRDLITREAAAQGVPASIALGVAQTESGISQWTPSGNVITSSAGALGVFQLMPATAAGLGVDPTDLNGNIQGGITYLKQLYAKFGSWESALAAYNWGPGNVSSGASVPTSVGRYVSDVLTAAGNFAAGLLGMAPAVPAVPGDPAGELTAGGLDSGVTGLSSGLIAASVVVAAVAIAWAWD